MTDNDIPEIAMDEEIRKLTEEIQTAQDKRPWGIKPEELTAYVAGGKHKWQFTDTNPRHIRLQMASIMDKLKVKVDKLEKSEKPDTAVARIKLEEGANKQTLELALEGFDYDDLVDHHAVDPFELSFLASEIYSFLVVNGGKAGIQQLQTLQKLDTLNRLLISRDSRKNGKSSLDSKTESGG